MQLVFKLETKNKEGSDYIYLKSILSRFYTIRGVGININYIFLNGKGNYNKINNKINKYKNYYQGQTQIIYLIDVDNKNIKYDQAQMNIEITNYCARYKYELIWFNRTIEEVLTGNIVENNKTKIALGYFISDKVCDIEKNNLYISDINRINIKQSNNLYILDKYLPKNNII